MRINRRATAEQAHDTVGGHFHRYEGYLYPDDLALGLLDVFTAARGPELRRPGLEFEVSPYIHGL